MRERLELAGELIVSQHRWIEAEIPQHTDVVERVLYRDVVVGEREDATLRQQRTDRERIGRIETQTLRGFMNEHGSDSLLQA